MADENTPISIDSAVSLMLPADPVAKTADGATIPAAGETPKAPADAQADGAPSEEQRQDTDHKPEAPSADGQDTKPAQDDAPAAKDGDVDPGSLPLIEAPAGWTAEEKEAFTSSPRKAQEAILRREQERTAALRDGQNATAEERKAVAAEVTRLKGLADRVEASLVEHTNDIAREFPEVKDQASLEALAASDPGRFSLFQARLMRFNAAQEVAKEAQSELQKKTAEATREAMKASHEKLVQVFPTWKDPAVATKEVTELQDYAIKTYGVSERAARMMHDPVIYQMAHKAKLYDAAQAARAAAVNREAPRTVKPGTSSPPDKGARAAADRAKGLAKLDKSGDLEDAVALMFK